MSRQSQLRTRFIVPSLTEIQNYYPIPVLRSVCLMQSWQSSIGNCSTNLYPCSISFSLQAEESTYLINEMFITLHYGSQELLPELVCPIKHHTQPLLFLWSWFVECNDLSSFQFCPVSPKLASYLVEFKAFMWQNLGKAKANYPQELAQDAVCQSHTGHMTGLWFLPTRPLRLNTNEWMMNVAKHIIYKCKHIHSKNILIPLLNMTESEIK